MTTKTKKIVNDFYSLAPKYRTKKRLIEMLEKVKQAIAKAEGKK